MGIDTYKSTPVSFTLFEWQIDALRKESHERGMSVSAVVRERLFGDRAESRNAEFKDTPEYAEILHRLKELEARQIVSRIPATVLDTAECIAGSVGVTHVDRVLQGLADGRPSIHEIANRQRAVKGFNPDKGDDDE